MQGDQTRTTLPFTINLLYALKHALCQSHCSLAKQRMLHIYSHIRKLSTLHKLHNTQRIMEQCTIIYDVDTRSLQASKEVLFHNYCIPTKFFAHEFS